jgi:hypothetical protein
MFMKTNYRHRLLFLSACIVLFYILQSGCGQSNESKIIGSWKNSLQIDKPNPATIMTLWKFDKVGGIKVDVKTVSNNKENIISTLTGKYKFKDRNTITYSFYNNAMRTNQVSFPDKDTMLFGIDKLERIK